MSAAPDNAPPEKGGSAARRRGSFLRSLSAKALLLAVVFVAVPIVVYDRLSAADEEKRQLLLAAVSDKGVTVSRALTPFLSRIDSVPFIELGQELKRFAADGLSLKLMFNPTPQAAGGGGFYYIAAAPAVPPDELAFERDRLIESGLLQRLSRSCQGELPLALRIDQPNGAGEVLTALNSVTTRSGCWVLLVSRPLDGAIARPYWQAPEVRAAAVAYLALAILAAGLFLGLWRSLNRFGRIARTIRGQGSTSASFAERNTIPELAEVATDFDRMVATLRASASGIRRAAEDGAHAFKAPIAVLRLSFESLRRDGNPGETRAGLAMAAALRAVDRLEGLVAAMRRLDWATADILEMERRPVDLARLCRDVTDSVAEDLPPAAPKLELEAPLNLNVMGSESGLETVIENLIDNAIGFTPAGGTIKISLLRQGETAVLAVEDDGPGVAAENLERIFQRYYSSRTTGADGGDGSLANGTPSAHQDHFGIGLWIVRRNIEAMGGRVFAANRAPTGLKMTVELPLA